MNAASNSMPGKQFAGRLGGAACDIRVWDQRRRREAWIDFGTHAALDKTVSVPIRSRAGR
jgi:hypothetical protein